MDVSLVAGWLPIAVQSLAALCLVVVLARSGRRWWALWVPVALVAGVVASLLVAREASDAGAANDPAPVVLWVWAGAVLAALVLAVAGWRGARWWRRTVAVVAVPLVVLSAGVVLNQWVGYLPTVGAAWAQARGAELPDQVDEGDLTRGGPAPSHGAVVPISIPTPPGGFVHRQEYVYLPPAWFTDRDRTALPVIMMLGGEFSVATDWIRTGNAVAAADRYATAHDGVAPVLVLPDASGSFDNDTECVNGPRGRSADHLVDDVRPYVIDRFGLSADPARWAAAGFSTGGTCAIDLAVMHPDLFGTFDDISGDLAPNAGSRAQTVTRLFGGDVAAYDAFDPATVMARHGRYADTVGRFVVGSAPTPQRAAAQELCADAQRVGVRCTVEIRPGGHNWQFAARAFATDLAWLAERLSPGPPTTPT